MTDTSAVVAVLNAERVSAMRGCSSSAFDACKACLVYDNCDCTLVLYDSAGADGGYCSCEHLMFNQRLFVVAFSYTLVGLSLCWSRRCFGNCCCQACYPLSLAQPTRCDAGSWLQARLCRLFVSCDSRRQSLYLPTSVDHISRQTICCARQGQ